MDFTIGRHKYKSRENRPFKFSMSLWAAPAQKHKMICHISIGERDLQNNLIFEGTSTGNNMKTLRSTSLATNQLPNIVRRSQLTYMIALMKFATTSLLTLGDLHLLIATENRLFHPIHLELSSWSRKRGTRCFLQTISIPFFSASSDNVGYFKQGKVIRLTISNRCMFFQNDHLIVVFYFDNTCNYHFDSLREAIICNDNLNFYCFFNELTLNLHLFVEQIRNDLWLPSAN